MNKELATIREGPQHICGLPSFSEIAERKVVLEDWVELHRRSIEKALASMIHTSEPPFDFKKQFAQFIVDYRIESGGNPSTAYALRTVHFPTGRCPQPSMQEMVEEADADWRSRGSPDYVGYVICNCELHCTVY